AFLLNHSKEYHFAMSFGLFEFFIELWLFPTMKSFGIFNGLVTLAIVVASQILRSSAMITAGANFTHIVADRQEQSHRLVIHGVYKFFRHPSYTGFFYWAIGLQLMMGNPIAAVGYMIALYKFFSNRITYEERTLVSFFGDDYVAYKKNTKTYIPFIP
ncbi:Isoprenylcysteine carboxyl methyltransferase family-domain-containing protein, partial [Chytridium lagenaria]